MAGAGTVTLLVTDLVGSVELRQRLGDDEAEDLRRAHFALLRRALAGHGGHEVKNTGDGLMVAFPSAVEAVGCAVAMQQAVERHNLGGRGHRIDVRVGLNAGDATHEDDDYFGLAVDLAHRLCDAAGRGQIIASDLVRGLVATRGGHSFRPLDALSLKGVADPVAVYEVAWERAAGPTFALPQTLTPMAATAFVGRVGELETLSARWKEVAAGARSLALISGEPGIGKTRLAAELARRVHDEGATVLFGRCEEDAALPYQPFVDALVPHLGPDPVEALRQRAGLARPRRGEAIDAPAPPPSLGGEDIERYRFYEAIGRLLDELGSAEPLLLVLDDLHWADRPTLALLRHLFRRPAEGAFLVIGTYRDTELGRTHPLSETLDALARDGLGVRVPLSGLREEDVGALVRSLTDHGGERGDARLARPIHAETEGNPFFVEQICRHLAETGGAGGIPQGVRDAIGRRLSRLPQSCNDLLAVAAVVGREFELDLLARVTGRSEEDLLAEIDQARRIRVVEEVPAALDRWAFTHALLRETLHDELSTSHRVRLHKRIGTAIEELHSDGLDAHLPALAYHFHEAAMGGDLDKAIDYAERAAQRAAGSFAPEETTRLYQLALDALDLSPSPDPGRRCTLLLALAQACRWFDVERADAAGSEALGLARVLDDAVLFATAVQQQFGFEPGTLDEVQIALVKEALDLLPPDDSGIRAVMLACLAAAEGIGLGMDRATLRDRGRQALEMAARVGTADQRAFVAYYTFTDRDSRATADELDALAASGAPEWQAPGICLSLGSDLAEGDRSRFDADLERLGALARDTHSPLLEYVRSTAATTIALLECRFAEAREAARLGLERQAFGPKYARAVFATWSIQEFGRLADQGRFAAIEPGARAAAAAYPLVPGWRASLALVLAESGRHDEALEELESFAADGFRAAAALLGADFTLCALARTCARLGATAHAEALYGRLDRFAGTSVVISYGPGPVFYAGAVAHYQGLLAAVLGNDGAAERHFADALSTHTGLRSPSWTAFTQFELGRLLQRRGGDAARGQELIASAGATADRLGLGGLRRDIDALAT